MAARAGDGDVGDLGELGDGGVVAVVVDVFDVADAGGDEALEAVDAGVVRDVGARAVEGDAFVDIANAERVNRMQWSKLALWVPPARSEGFKFQQFLRVCVLH